MSNPATTKNAFNVLNFYLNLYGKKRKKVSTSWEGIVDEECNS